MGIASDPLVPRSTVLRVENAAQAWRRLSQEGERQRIDTDPVVRGDYLGQASAIRRATYLV